MTLLLLYAGLGVSKPAEAQDAAPDVASLIAAERAFARAASEQGTRAAFLANLADDAVVFRPGPVNGKEAYAGQPETDELLSWEPAFAAIARAGDLGYTTGPWSFKQRRTDAEPAAFGHFVSIWKRPSTGPWQVAVDIGIAHPSPAPPVSEVGTPVPAQPMSASRPPDQEEARMALLEAERTFADVVDSAGPAVALLQYAAADVRLYRPNAYPAVGIDASEAMLEADTTSWTWEPVEGVVSRSGDLGYTYGSAKANVEGAEEPPTGSYLHIWQRQPDGAWQLVLDLLNPIHSPADPQEE